MPNSLAVLRNTHRHCDYVCVKCSVKMDVNCVASIKTLHMPLFGIKHNIKSNENLVVTHNACEFPEMDCTN